MKQLDIILAHSQLLMLRRVLISSIDEIKEKHPTRIDLISSMEKRTQELMEATIVFHKLEKEHNQVLKKLYSLHEDNLRLKKENKELKELL